MYVAGSGRWSLTGNLALSDAIASPDDQGSAPNTIRYDYGVSAAFYGDGAACANSRRAARAR